MQENRYIYQGLKKAFKIILFCLTAGIAVRGAIQGKPAEKAGDWLETHKSGRWIEAVWNQAYPLYGLGEKEQADRGQNLFELIFHLNPVFRWQNREEYRNHDIQPDPAYERYVEGREFYQEHQYLLKYGAEDTELEENPTASAAEEKTEAAASAQEGMLPVTGRTYALEQLADYDFLMKQFYNIHPSTTIGRDQIDAAAMLEKDMTLQGGNDKPQILIYHTHSQESFADSGEGENVVGIGNYLTELLTKKGYHVIHDTSVYDLRNGVLDRNKAYTYALEGISRILEENPSIEVVMDLHRDGVGKDVRLVSQVNGKPTAQIMFFNGMSQTPEGPVEYLENPYRDDNLAFSFQMQMKAAAYFPGYTRKIYLKGLRYNLHLRPKSTLVEVGAQTNTYEEAKNAMEPLAELLDMVLQGN